MPRAGGVTDDIINQYIDSYSDVHDPENANRIHLEQLQLDHRLIARMAILPTSSWQWLISKLRHDAALYFPYEGPYPGRGRPKKYGHKLDYRRIPERYRKSSSVDKGTRTAVYQMLMWHKCFAEQINIVLVVKTNLRTGATAHVVLFSSDRELPHDGPITAKLR